MKSLEVNILKKAPVFSELSDIDLEQISSVTIERNLRKGTIIFMEGDKGDAFYFIKSGKVKIYKTTPDGRELIFAILGEGDVFAEVALFNDVPYPAGAEVLEDACIGMIRNEDLENLIKKNTEIALHIIKVFSKKLYSSQQKVKELALGDTYARTAQTIIKLGQSNGKQTSSGIELQLDISRQDLANLIGTARETVSRALSQFKKEGSIDIDKRKIIIKDMEKLEEWIK